MKEYKDSLTWAEAFLVVFGGAALLIVLIVLKNVLMALL